MNIPGYSCRLFRFIPATRSGANLPSCYLTAHGEPGTICFNKEFTELTTFLSALALFFFGGEVIHDFSLAMLLGIAIGTYSSVFVASPLLVLLGKVKSPKIEKKEKIRT